MHTQEFKTEAGHIYCKVTTDEEQQLIVDSWFGSFGKQENFLKVLYYVAGEIKKHNIKKWLANIQEMIGGFDSSRQELNEKIMPQVIKAGLLQEAIVLPKQIFSTLSTKDAVMKINNLNIQMFSTYKEATTWLNIYSNLNN